MASSPAAVPSAWPRSHRPGVGGKGCLAAAPLAWWAGLWGRDGAGRGWSGPRWLNESSWGQVSSGWGSREGHPCPPGPSEVWGKGLSCERGFHAQAWPPGHAPGEATGGVEGGFPEARRPGEERGGQDVGAGEEGTGREGAERAAGEKEGEGEGEIGWQGRRQRERRRPPLQVLCTICGCEKALLRQPEQDRDGRSMSRP